MKSYSYYKDLTIDEKINAKSWGFFKCTPICKDGGFFTTMIKATAFYNFKDPADFTKHHIFTHFESSRPMI